MSSAKFYDSSNNEFSGELDFAGVENGIPSTAVEVRVINAKDAASGVAFTNGRLIALARISGFSDFRSSGIEAVDRHWMQARITGGYNLSIPPSPWKRLGTGVAFPLPDLGVDEGVILEIRAYPPVGADTTDVEIGFKASPSPVTRVPFDMAHAGLGGVVMGGVGSDIERTEHLLANDVVEDSGGPSNDVEIVEQIWLAAGYPRRAAADVTIAASASGFERWVLLSLAADGTITQTASTEVSTGTLTEDDKPGVPDGELALAYVRRDDTATIVDADITQVYEVGAYAVSVKTGRVLNVGPGRAVVGSSLVEHVGVTELTAPESDTSWLWVTQDGQFVFTSSADPPEAYAQAIAEVTTTTVAVTDLVDLRRFTGGELETVTFDFPGTLAANDERYSVSPLGRRAFAVPIRGAVGSVGAIGDGSTGRLAFDIEVERSGTFELLTGAGNEPELSNGATDLVHVSNLADYEVPPNARLRATVSEIPGSSTVDPSDGTVKLWLMVS